MNNIEHSLKTAYVSSNGCPENLIDSARLRKYLETNGWHIEEDPDNAELVFFNACGLTKAAEEQSLSNVKNIQSRIKKTSRLFVWGCLPKINPKALETVYDGSLFGEQELFSKIDEIIKTNTPIGGIFSNELCPKYTNYSKNYRIHWPTIPFNILYDIIYQKYITRGNTLNLCRADDSIFYIKASTGCLGNCTYCVIRKSRGVVKSKSMEAIVQEFRSGLSMGYKQFNLLGTDLGGQGSDLGYDLCDLLNKLIEEKGDYKIGIRNINPFFAKQMLDELEPILKTGKIGFIGMAAESGSNRILKLMGRKYTVEDYIECFQRMKAACPGIIIDNQMLIGFPTETEQDFAASMRLIDVLDCAYTEMYSFSSRPGAAAEKMEGQIPQYIIKLRAYRMLFKIVVNQRR